MTYVNFAFNITTNVELSAQAGERESVTKQKTAAYKGFQ
jgi:hypothetical protein